MKKEKYLAKNIGLLTLSQFGSKILIFFLVPLYTYVLSTAEYGIYDLINVSISLLIPIFTLNITDSSLRFALDEDVDKTDVFNISLRHYGFGVLVFTVLLFLNRLTGFVPMVDRYVVWVWLMFVATAAADILAHYARGIDKVAAVAVGGVISTVVVIGLNLLFLLPLHMGLVGYFAANILGLLAQALYLFIAVRGWKLIAAHKMNKPLKRAMLAYSAPQVFNATAWWVNNASDRYIVTWLCGLPAMGIYSVGYKIPAILNVFQTIFSQAWTLSAVKEYDPEDKNGFFAGLYNVYDFLMIFVCSGLIVFARVFATFLYSKDFYAAWQYVPFLTVAIVFGSMVGFIGGVFSAVKDAKALASTTVVGAVVNVVLTVPLTWWIGPLGAAIGTAASYVVVWVMRLVSMRKYIKMKLNLVRDITAYVILITQSVVLLCFDKWDLVGWVLELACLAAILLLFRRECKAAWEKFMKKAQRGGER